MLALTEMVALVVGEAGKSSVWPAGRVTMARSAADAGRGLCMASLAVGNGADGRVGCRLCVCVAASGVVAADRCRTSVRRIRVSR